VQLGALGPGFLGGTPPAAWRPPEPGRIVGLVYAHQGGWDEMLMVLVPLLVIAGLLRLARNRARRNEPPGEDSDGVSPGDG
jgi:hypothetical protein